MGKVDPRLAEGTAVSSALLDMTKAEEAGGSIPADELSNVKFKEVLLGRQEELGGVSKGANVVIGPGARILETQVLSLI